MKKLLLLLLFTGLVSGLVAQAPQKFNYQAVARNASGEVLTDQDITVRIGILQNESLVWQEDHDVRSNQFGLITLQIGSPDAMNASGSAGSFSAIDWGSAAFKINIKMDVGSGFQDMGNAELNSVPYALFAANGPVGPAGPQGEQGDPASDDQTLSLDGNILSISGGNDVSLAAIQDGVEDADADPTNEIQDLTFNAGLIRLTGDPGNTVIDIDGRINSTSGWELDNDTITTLRPVAISTKNEQVIEPLFEVRNDLGNPVFAVFNDGVMVYVDEEKKGVKGGFAVGGYNRAKGSITQDFMRITPDSIRFWVPDAASEKGVKGGFAVGGYNRAKAGSTIQMMSLTALNYLIGEDAGLNITTGIHNSFLGFQAGLNNTTGRDNIFLGRRAGSSNVGAVENIFIGNGSGFSTVGGYGNVFVGNESGFLSTAGYYNTLLGYQAGYNNATHYNTFIGYQAGYNNKTGKNNLALGFQAGYGAPSNGVGVTGNDNIFMGSQAGLSNTVGNNNIFIGRIAGFYNDAGTDNIFIGNSSGQNTANGNYNTFIGYRSGYFSGAGITTDPSFNTFIGYQTGYNNRSGQYNTYIGYNAGYSGTNATGSNNVMIGDNSGNKNVSGANNVFMGNNSGFNNLSATNNVFIGKDAGYSTSQGGSNVMIGYQAGYTNLGSGGSWDGDYNVFLGYQAGYSNLDGAASILIGYQAGYSNTSSNYLTAIGFRAGTTALGEYNTFVGGESGYFASTGDRNSYFGFISGRGAEGNDNTYVGYSAGYNGNGNQNVFVGSYSGSGNSGGAENFNNTMVGYMSGGPVTSGSNNTFLGHQTARYASTANSNVLLGYQAGYSISTGSNNVFIGNQAGYFENNSNRLYIANSSTTLPLIYGDFSTSDLRFNATIGINRSDSDAYGLMVDGGSSATYSLIVYKGAYAYDNGFVSASDASLKTDIKQIENALEMVNSLRGVNFKWKDGPIDSDQNDGQIGLIAQEVELILPQIVTENAEGLKGVAYDKLTAVLIEAIKEQQAEIEELKAERQNYEDLSEKIRILEEKMNEK